MEKEEYSYKWYTFGCRDAGYLHEKKQHTPLRWGEKILYYFHLTFCHLCRRYIRHLKLIQHHFYEWMKEIKLSSAEKEKLKVLIREAEK